MRRMPAEAGNAQVDEIAIAVELPALRTEVTGFRAPKQDEQTIRPDAKLLFVAGAGWTKKQPDGAVHVEEAGKTHPRFPARFWCVARQQQIVSRSGRRREFCSSFSDAYESGRTNRLDSAPPKGLSTCCHGEEPHVVGWRFIGERRAISLDANCGWTRGKADVVYIADAFQVMAKVNELLKSS